MLTIRIAIGTDWFEFSGEGALADVRTLITEWFAARTDAHAQEAIDKLAAQARRDNDALGASVASNTPSS